MKSVRVLHILPTKWNLMSLDDLELMSIHLCDVSAAFRPTWSFHTGATVTQLLSSAKIGQHDVWFHHPADGVRVMGLACTYAVYSN